MEEIPVFLAKGLQDNVCIFQYPSKTNQTNFDTARVLNCCVKPMNQEVKIDFALDTDSKFYDSFKGEQLAMAADGKGTSKADRPSFRSGIMDKLSYVSSKSLDDVNKYVVGILQDGEVHMTTLKSVLQLRPNFSYFDKEDKRTKAEQKAANDEMDDEEVQQVTVKFSRNDNDRVKKAREKTYDYFIKKSAEEPWCETLWCSKDSTTAELEKQKLFASRTESTGHALGLNSEQYLDKLLSHERSEADIESILPSKVISKSKLKTLALTDQIQTILKDTKMITFAGLMSILESCDKNITAEKVLRTLPLVGVLLHGNWVAQSEVLYPPKSVSNTNGVPDELMVRARDYILYKFSKQDYLNRRKVIISTQLPYEEVSEILQSVARLNVEKKWELLLPPDHTFEARYPDLVQRQEMMWRARENAFNEMDYEKSPKRVRKRSLREPKIEKP